MNKEETIAKYGEAAWQEKLERDRAYYKAHKEQKKAYQKKYKEEHPEEVIAADKKYREEHPEEVIANHQEQNRKGGKYYDKKLKDNQTGLQGDRNKIRLKHRNQYRPFKNIIAPESQIHHEWVPTTAEYRGLALVAKDAHQYGIVDVIQILEGKITLLTEEEVKYGKKNLKVYKEEK
jgi:hypothetical protein